MPTTSSRYDRHTLQQTVRWSICILSIICSIGVTILWLLSLSRSAYAQGGILGSHYLLFESQRGRLACELVLDSNAAPMEWKWGFRDNAEEQLWKRQSKDQIYGFRFEIGRIENKQLRGCLLFVPHWFAIAVGVVASIVVLRCPASFSMRTIILATTVLALLLGLLVALGSN